MKYGMHFDDVHATLVIRKHDDDWKPEEHELELRRDEVGEHVYMDLWTSRKPRRITRRDQSFPRLMALMEKAEDEGKVRI